VSVQLAVSVLHAKHGRIQRVPAIVAAPEPTSAACRPVCPRICRTGSDLHADTVPKALTGGGFFGSLADHSV